MFVVLWQLVLSVGWGFAGLDEGFMSGFVCAGLCLGPPVEGPHDKDRIVQRVSDRRCLIS